MKERKDIDRLFQESLKDFEELPAPKVWNAIESKIQTPPNKHLLPLRLRGFRVAMIVAISLTIAAVYMLPKYDYFSILPKTNDSELLSSKKQSEKNINAIKKETQPEGFVVEKKLNVTQDNENKTVDNENIDINLKKKKSTGFLQNEIDYLNSISKKRKVDKKKIEKQDNNFTISTVFAPIYSNSFASEKAGLLNNGNILPNLSYAYGVKFAYQLSKKFSLQSGINIVNIGYSANDIYVATNVSAVNFSHLSNNRFKSLPELMASTEPMASASSQLNEKGILNQIFGYVEIPLELKYNLINGKIGMNIVGGFSTFLLNKNEAFIQTNSFSQSLGEMKDIRSVNFSGNIGVDVDYLINKNLYINVSPMLKMQTGTFINDSHGFYPYYLGIYTGINYKF